MKAIEAYIHETHKTIVNKVANRNKQSLNLSPPGISEEGAGKKMPNFQSFPK